MFLSVSVTRYMTIGYASKNSPKFTILPYSILQSSPKPPFLAQKKFSKVHHFAQKNSSKFTAQSTENSPKFTVLSPQKILQSSPKPPFPLKKKFFKVHHSARLLFPKVPRKIPKSSLQQIT